MTDLTTKLAEALRDCRKSLVAIIDGEGGIGLEAPEVIDADEALRLFDAATALPVQDLPPLPPVDYDAGWHRQYTADQMHDYARAAIAATPAPAELEKAHEALRQAQSELAYFEARLACARLTLMRELKEQGWAPAPAPLTDEQIDGLDLAGRGVMSVRDMVRIVERAHGIGASEGAKE